MRIADKLKNTTKSGNRAFEITKQAKKAETAAGKDAVIKATLGVLADEKGDFLSLKTVQETYRSLLEEDLFNYAPDIGGSEAFKEAVKKNVFRDHLKDFAGAHIGVCATPGGTGAIHNTFRMYLNPGETVLLPEYMWENYKQLAGINGLRYETYSMFTNAQIDSNDFFEKIMGVMKKNGRVLIVINDPCHNPTGYSLSFDEWKNLIDTLKKAASFGEVIIVNDIAYIDYDSRPVAEARRYMTLFADMPENMIAILAFSASKSFTCYGLRVGAAVAVSKDKAAVDEFVSYATLAARSTWSNISHGGVALVEKIGGNPGLTAEVDAERAQVAAMLKKRNDAFLEEAQKCGLTILPFRDGFFMSVPVESSRVQNVLDGLRESNVFALPLEKGIRIATCGIPLEKARKLPQLIKDALLKYGK